MMKDHYLRLSDADFMEATRKSSAEQTFYVKLHAESGCQMVQPAQEHKSNFMHALLSSVCTGLQSFAMVEKLTRYTLQFYCVLKNCGSVYCSLTPFGV
jgi:aspartate/glutamate racemase